MEKTNKHLINKDASVKDALVQINGLASGEPFVLFVYDGNTVVGSVTDGDIRRALIAGVSTNDSIQTAMNRNYHNLDSLNNYERIKELKYKNLKLVPLINENKELIEFVNLENIKSILPLDAVIMAGGGGIRLRPYTNSVPKPMIDLNGKPIIEYNIERLISYGIRNIYVSVNYLKDVIKTFIAERYKDCTNVNFYFIEENEPLGTIGSVGLVGDFEHDDVLIMNADILSNIDFEDFYVNYKNHNDEMSVATFSTKVSIPYAVIETENKRIKSFVEKPDYEYYSNAGIYLLKKENIKLIPKNCRYDTTDMIQSLIEQGKQVSHFPIRGYWIDIGNLQNLEKAKDDIKFVKF